MRPGSQTPSCDPNFILRAAWSNTRKASGLHSHAAAEGCAASISSWPQYELATQPTAGAAPLRSAPCPLRSWGRLRARRGSGSLRRTRQGAPVWVQAPQRGRSLRRSGEPSPASPISARRLHLPPIPQAESEQVRSRVAGQTIQPCRCQWLQLSLVTPGGGGFASAASIAAWRAASFCRSFSRIRAAIWRENVMFCQVPRKTP